MANLIGALRKQGTTCIVLTSESAGEHSESVRRLPPLRPASLWGRVKAHLAWRLHFDTWHGRRVAGQIHDEVVKLRTSSSLDLIEIDEAFGRALWLAPISPVPVVVRLHGPWFSVGSADGALQDASFKARVRNEGLGIAAANGVTAPSTFVLEQVRSHYGLALPQAEVIPNPVETVPSAERWNLARCERNLILFVGRFDRVKGGDLIVDAFARVVRDMPAARLAFVGPDRGLLDDAGKHWTLGSYVESKLDVERDRVALLGVRSGPEILELRRRAHVTVVPSRFENLPMTMIEAMAMGCPLVVSDAGGLPEAMADGVSALSFHSGDASHMAARIQLLLSNDALQRRACGAPWSGGGPPLQREISTRARRAQDD